MHCLLLLLLLLLLLQLLQESCPAVKCVLIA